MLAQWCLTAWKVAIGRPNWTRTLAYSAACWVVSVAIPMASAANTALAVSVSSRRAPVEQHRGRRVEPHPGRSAALVKVGRDGDRDAARRPLHQGDVVAHRDQQHVGEVAADHHARVAGDGVARERDVAAEGDRADDAAVRQTGQQPRGQPGRRACRPAPRWLAGRRPGRRSRSRSARTGRGRAAAPSARPRPASPTTRTRSRRGRPGCAARAGRGPPVRPRSPAAAPPRLRAGRGRRHGSGAWPGGRKRSARARGALR